MVILVLLVTITICIAQDQFVYALGGSSYETGNSIIQTEDGGFAIIGRSRSFSAGMDDLFFLKMDNSFSTQWARVVLNPPCKFEGNSVIQNEEGNFIISANYQFEYLDPIYGYILESYYLIMSFSEAGSLLWSSNPIFGGNGGYIRSKAIEINGNYYLLSLGEVPFAKFDSEGDFILASSGDGFLGYDFAKTTDNGMIISGLVGGSHNIVVVKLDTTLAVEWARELEGGSSSEVGYSILQTSDGGFIVVGSSKSYGATERDIFIVKLSSIDSIQWCMVIDGPQDDIGYSVIEREDNSYIIAGHTRSFGTSGSIFVLSLDYIGSLEWFKIIDGTGVDNCVSLYNTIDGGFVLTGDTRSYGSGYTDIIAAKFDEFGNCCIGEDVIPDVLSISPTLTELGYSTFVTTPTFLDTPKTVIEVTITPFEICNILNTEEVIAKPGKPAISAHPNPFNSAVTISLDCRSESAEPLSTLEIFDINGRRVGRIPPAPLNKGGAEFSEAGGSFLWTPSTSLGSGVYLVRAKVSGEYVSKRIVYLK